MPGNPRVVALWERGSVSFEAVKKLFRPEQVDKVLLMRRSEENIKYVPVSQEDIHSYKVEIHESGFLPEADYRKILEEPGVYRAPRLKEGIGMSFLEQMAMGRCVIAHHDSTMDEYIKDGWNGLLVDMRNPYPVEAGKIEKVRLNARKSIAEFNEKWESDKDKILQFFSRLDGSKILHSPWSLRSILWYAWYLIEGALLRIKR
jgi:glycosyltransferase involved in cell wall biosynthesis